MRTLNEVKLICNLVRDPDFRTTKNQIAMCSLVVATNNEWKDKATGQPRSETEFHSIVCWAQLAEFAGKFFRKGDSLFIEGRLKTRSWDDPATGEKKYRTEIIAGRIDQLRRAENEGSLERGTLPATQPAPAASGAPEPEPIPAGE